MGSYEIRWKRSAERDLRNIDRQQIRRIIKTVESLADTPFPRQCRKLRGSENLYQVRVGDYRAIYHVDTGAKTVTLYFVRHREEAYRVI